MAKKCISILAALVLTVGLLATTTLAVSVPENSYLSSTQDSTGTTTYTGKTGSQYTVYIYPAGTEFYMSPSSMGNIGGQFTLTAWDTRVVGDDYFNNDYAFYTNGWDGKTNFCPEPGVIYDIWVSDSMTMGGQSYIMVEGGGTQPEPKPEVDQPSGWAQGYVKEAVEANIVPEELQSGYTQRPPAANSAPWRFSCMRRPPARR